MTKDDFIGIRVASDLKQALSKQAEKDNRTLSNQVELILKQGVQK